MFTLKISTANEAFDNESYEIARILCEVAHDIGSSKLDRDQRASGIIRDINGNTVGKWELR